MPILGSVASYFKVRPVGVRNAIRIYLAYTAAIFVRSLMPSKFKTVGFLIPGRSNLMVSMNGISANVRPRTSDLGAFAAVLEPETAAWFQVGTGDTVVDVGAHIGRYSLLAARRASRVIAVEPEPSNYAMLKQNVALNGFSNVTVVLAALSNRSGRARLYLPKSGDTASNSLEPNGSGGLQKAGQEQGIEVECETLDDLVLRLGLQSVDWLKIDVEGHEVSVLKGGQRMLNKVRRLIIEVADSNAKACRALLNEVGFETFAVERIGKAPLRNWLLFRREQPGECHE
jgi:FkbM family methyltransferase